MVATKSGSLSDAAAKKIDEQAQAREEMAETLPRKELSAKG